jgi:3-methyl-2-oxobutanoate hydroxymethyltransferase
MGAALEALMSVAPLSGQNPSAKITVSTIQEKKSRHEPITVLTAYDYATARLVDEAGIDVVLVGDSLAMVVLGYENTLSVTMDEMLHHTRAARRGVKRALLVADMPYGSYQIDEKEAVRNAVRFMREAGAEAVKLEGGAKRVDLIHRMLDAEIPIMGHIGLTPQSVHRMGGYKVQGKTLAAAEQLMRDAIALDKAGVFSIVLEGIPREVASLIRHEVSVPTIGIGAGPDCDGQVLVLHDILNLSGVPPAKFVRTYANVGNIIGEAARRFKDDVNNGVYPAESESYHLPPETQTALDHLLVRKASFRR